MVSTSTLLIALPIIVGVLTLLIKQIFTCYKDVRRSDCWGIHVEMEEKPDVITTHSRRASNTPPMHTPHTDTPTHTNDVEKNNDTAAVGNIINT